MHFLTFPYNQSGGITLGEGFFFFFWSTEISVHLGWAEFFSLSPLSAYFHYYSWVSIHFLMLLMNPTVLFNLFFNFFSTLSTKKFQFQLNKLFQTDTKCG